MANDTLSFAKTLEGIMKRIKNIIQAFEQVESLSKDYVDLANKYLGLSKKYEGLWRSYCESKDQIREERAQKERYRTAFLDRMNVPVTGKAWTGDDGYSEES